MKRTIAGVVVGMLGVLALSACGGSNNALAGNSSATPSPAGTIVVGSANFPEDEVLAQIYYQALTAKGIKASTKLDIGSREVYFPGLKDGSIDLVPDYSGTLLQYLQPSAKEVTPTDVYAALQKALPSGLSALTYASAEDKDAVVVTKQTADQYHAKSISDLASHCGDLVFGGPPEFQTRPDGIPGIAKTYNCTFKSYSSLDPGAITSKALTDGNIQAADIFTTDASIQANGFVALADPKNNFSAQNVVPIINTSKATAQVKDVLNAVSAKLDTAQLLKLNADLAEPSKPSTASVAKQWLQQEGLI
jgi:osmoprotectant transport system substrate-binding protein